MAKALSFANDVLDDQLPNTASGTTTIGTSTYTFPFKCKFLSTVSVAATAGTEWSTSAGYTAGGVSIAGLFTVVASAASKSNTGAITVTNAPAQTWADNEICDSTGKRVVFKGTPSFAKAVNLGDTCTIPVANFQSSEA